MDRLKNLKHLNWCKSDWKMQKIEPEAIELLRNVDVQHNIVDLNNIMEKSESFPIPFPIDSIRVKTLKDRVSKDILERNIKSTYPLIHERVLRLMAQFIIVKRKYGSSIEKALYETMTVPRLIDRLFTKRALNFMTKLDKYKLITGEKGAGGWESIGTPSEREPLILAKCLSYDELKLSAFLYVSSYTVCINDGARQNKAVVQDDDLVESEAVIIGVIGPRFQRESRMDCEDILVTEKQNTKENGYGEYEDNAKCVMKKLWADFYETKSYTFHNVLPKISQQSTQNLKKDERQFTSTFLKVGKEGAVFNNEVYHKRISIIAECSLLEAQKRALEVKKNAFFNVIGCGLGVWKISAHQNDVYVLSFVERIRSLLDNNSICNVTDVNFAYIKITNTLKSYFQKDGVGLMKIFIKNSGHPAGGISITLQDREPSSRLKGEHEGKLLVMTYPWDGNAQPGNEFWLGKLSSSGDPAAACSTQVSELHNPFINNMVNAAHTWTVNNAHMTTMKEYCQNVG